jgi:hypothetical protein
VITPNQQEEHAPRVNMLAQALLLVELSVAEIVSHDAHPLSTQAADRHAEVVSRLQDRSTVSSESAPSSWTLGAAVKAPSFGRSTTSAK